MLFLSHRYQTLGTIPFIQSTSHCPAQHVWLCNLAKNIISLLAYIWLCNVAYYSIIDFATIIMRFRWKLASLSQNAKRFSLSIAYSKKVTRDYENFTLAACGAVACLFSVSRPSVPQFVVEQCSPDYLHTSPASESCCPLCQTACNKHICDVHSK